MKLYYSPGACSLAPHIILLETRLPFDLERVHLPSRTTASGKNYLEINPHGYVPTLEIEDGSYMTEVPVIMQYIADRVPDQALAPKSGTRERYELLSWLNFISSEIHKGFGPLFADDTPIHYKPSVKDRLRKRFEHVESCLSRAPYLLGGDFSIADAHLWVMIKWTRMVGIDLDRWAALVAFEQKVRSRPSVQQALQIEGVDW